MSQIVDDLSGIEDPAQRAAACQRFLVNGRETLRVVEQIRNAAIRTARPDTTIDRLASIVGVKRNIIVSALRRGA